MKLLLPTGSEGQTPQLPVQLLYTLDNPRPIDYAQFGQTVDIYGAYAIVGAYGWNQSRGAAYVYDTQTGALLHTIDGSTLDVLGQSVAIWQTRFIVGAHGNEKAFIRSNATGGLLHTLTSPTSTVDALFGHTVDIAEDYAIVGAMDETVQIYNNAGTAYIYDTTTGGLLHTIISELPQEDAEFGEYVAISDTHFVVGSPEEDSRSGVAYVYDNATGNLVHTVYNPVYKANAQFGLSVAISDTTFTIGAPYVDSVSGKAYIYDIITGDLIKEVINPNTYGSANNDQFAKDLGCSSDFLVLGAPNEDAAEGTDSGAAYIFSLDGTQFLWTFNNPNLTAWNEFGQSVETSNTQTIVGAPHTDGASPQQGIAYIYTLGDTE